MLLMLMLTVYCLFMVIDLYHFVGVLLFPVPTFVLISAKLGFPCEH